ncbi:MAG TPA: glycosyltransferase [Candidatus Methylomirabilis sp.]|nr:glycosyltransferase [Candidatus Methylomirabilis sp.]
MTADVPGDPQRTRPTLYLAPHRWDGQRQRAHHLAAGLARSRPVLFVEPAAHSFPGTVRRRLAGEAPPRPGLRRISDGLAVYAPVPTLPWSLSSRPLNRAVHYLTWRGLQATLDALRWPAVDVLVGWPPAFDLARLAAPRRLVYDCLDLFPAFETGRRRWLLERLETQLSRAASEVVVTSNALERRWRERHARVLRIPNAVEWDLFGRGGDSHTGPGDLDGLKRPRLGYVGTLGPWTDLPLLTTVARQRPDVSIVLVGPAERGVAPPTDVPNLRWLGQRPYASLPAYLASMDVLLVPFRLMDLTHAVNPIKFYEYCATGKPIVATPLEELTRFPELCHLGEGTQAFLSAVDAAVAEAAAPDPRRVAARRQFASANTWDHRVQAFARLLDEPTL